MRNMEKMKNRCHSEGMKCPWEPPVIWFLRAILAEIAAPGFAHLAMTSVFGIF